MSDHIKVDLHIPAAMSGIFYLYLEERYHDSSEIKYFTLFVYISDKFIIISNM